MKGLDIPKLINDPIIVSFDSVDFIEQLEKLPDFLQEKIKSSKEYFELTGEISEHDTN